jgi:hypothetical protein
MKPTDIATIGVRLVGVASIAFGGVLALTAGVMHGLFQLPLAGVSTSELHLHDTYYVIADGSYNLLVPGGAGILVGGVLLLLSRRIARFIVRGVDDSRDER